MTSLFLRRATTLALLLSKPLDYTPSRSYSDANEKRGSKLPGPTAKRAAVKAARKQNSKRRK